MKMSFTKFKNGIKTQKKEFRKLEKLKTNGMNNNKLNNVRIPFAEFMILLSVSGSILFSIYLFGFEKNYPLSLFIGLWAPTLMGVINYINIKFKQ
jgi:hypothetical protein